MVAGFCQSFLPDSSMRSFTESTSLDGANVLKKLECVISLGFQYPFQYPGSSLCKLEDSGVV